MRKDTFCRLITSVFLCLLFVGVSFGQARYEDLMDKADSFVKSGSFVEAFSVAQQAIKLDPNQFTAYYYAAFSLYKRGLLAEAEPYAKDAVSRATTTDKQTAQKLLDTIEGLKIYSEQIQIGDQAMQGGLINKAAIAYTKAFDGNHAQVETGMKAVELWLNRLDNILQAVRILNIISKQSSGSETSNRAQSLLDNLKPRISNQYNALMAGVDSLISQKKYDEAIDQLNRMVDIYKTYFNPEKKFQNQVTVSGEQGLHLKLMKLYGVQKRTAEAIKEFAEVVKIGDVNLSYLLTTDYLNDLMFDSDFQSFVGDALGMNQMAILKNATDIDATLQQLRNSIEDYYKGQSDGRKHIYSQPVPEIQEIQRKYGRVSDYDDSNWVTNLNGCTFTYNYEMKDNGKRQKDYSGSVYIDLSKMSKIEMGVLYDLNGQIVKTNIDHYTHKLPFNSDIIAKAIRLCKRGAK